MSIAIFATFEPIRTLGFASVVAGYTAIGTPLDHRASIVYLQNTTDKEVIISLDGTEDHLMLPAGVFYPLDVCNNKSSSEGLFIPYGTSFYVKRSAAGAPGSGAVSIAVVYASTDAIKG